MRNIFQDFIAAAIVCMQDRMSDKGYLTVQEDDLVRLGDAALCDGGYDAKDWGPYKIVDGLVHPIDWEPPSPPPVTRFSYLDIN